MQFVSSRHKYVQPAWVFGRSVTAPTDAIPSAFTGGAGSVDDVDAPPVAPPSAVVIGMNMAANVMPPKSREATARAAAEHFLRGPIKA